MKKSRLAIALTTLSSIALLSGCGNPVTKQGGSVLSLTANDQKVEYTADELFGNYKKSASAALKYYDAIYEVLVRNLFEDESLTTKKQELYEKAEFKVRGVEEEAKSNKESKGTDYDTEIKALYKLNGVETRAELVEKFVFDLMKEEVQTQYYDAKATWTKVGTDSTTLKTLTSDYLSQQLPYHVKHILVKLGTSSAQFYKSTLSETESKSLSGIVKRLATRQGGDNFGSLALEQSDDTGSKAASGNLGIMDKATSYVNEFKLGLYAYEALYNQTTSASISADTKALLVDPEAQDYMTTLGLGEIPYEAALLIGEHANKTKDNAGNQYNKGDANYFPRNIYFNKYFNKHNVSVIVPTKVDGTASPEYEGLAGFTTAVTELGGKKVLTDEKGNVILVVKAGAGSASSYEGVHFIVVERSALVADKNGVTLEEYYTTAIPGDANYPVTGTTPKETYINYMATERSTFQTRATEVKGKVKSFDKFVNYRIFDQLLAFEQVEIHDAVIKATVLDYIKVQKLAGTAEEKDAFATTWATWVEQLTYQEYYRSHRLVAESCAVSFVNNVAADFAEGGACYEAQ